MVQIKNMKFSTSIGVLFALKEQKGVKTLQETYKIFEQPDMDVMLDLLKASYMKQNKIETMTIDEFVEKLEEEQIGFIKIASVFQEVIEGVMYSGLSEEEIETKKKLVIPKS